MALREDVVSSAVAFLQDPSVASSSLDKRIAFLQSKNLTQEEIDTSLSRAGNGSQPASTTPPPPPPGQYRSMQQPAAGYGYGYGGYPPGGPWMQQPPEPPRRDWRDWFIMATMTAGVGYGLYTVAQRYVLPLISPPTPPQLQQDKTHIDESFNKAFALIDQLSTDTAELKASETERTEKLDTTIKEVDAVVADLKAANARREAESRIIADQVTGLKELVPKSLEQWKQNGDARLEELGLELQSLKKLLENRVGGRSSMGGGGGGMPEPRTMPTHYPPTKANGPPSTPSAETATSESAAPAPAPGVDVSRKENTSPKRMGAGAGGRAGGGVGGAARAAIPAWQMAAAKKNDSAATASNGEGGAEAGA